MLGNLSYRHKTPLAMSLVIVVAAAVVAGALLWQGFTQARASFVTHNQTLGKTLARTVRPALLHDDVWQAYEILLTPLERSGDTGRALILLDGRGLVFAASEPRQFAVLDDFVRAAEEPAVAAALTSLAPALSVPFAVVIGRERLGPRTLAGIFVVTAGIVLLVAFGRS